MTDSQPQFFTLRLGPASVAETLKIDAATDSDLPIEIEIKCKQAPETPVGSFFLVWLGSDNDKGRATNWKQGLRAVGRLVSRAGGTSRDDETTIRLSIGVALTDSIGRKDFIRRAPRLYHMFCALPVVGVDTHANQTIQSIEPNAEDRNLDALFAALGYIDTTFATNLKAAYPDLFEQIDFTLTTDPGDVERGNSQDCLPSGSAGDVNSEVWRLLSERKNVILYGPPGTGKTHAAFAIAEKWRSENGPDSVLNVTFHPAYAYEDFVQGYKPVEDNPGIFKLTPGALLAAASTANAVKSLNRSVLLVIDEINRGDVARIFGELITYIEPDKRGVPVHLAQTRVQDRTTPPFFVPDNLYFLGTMNSADKSISLLDVALRRRFAFVEYASDPMAFERIDIWVSEVSGIKLRSVLSELNRRLHNAGVESDRCVGHALLGIPKTQDDFDAVLADRFRYDIFPLVHEYCYLDQARVQRVLKPLADERGRPAWSDSNEFMRLLGGFVPTATRDSKAAGVVDT